jgi:hypothetical protein
MIIRRFGLMYKSGVGCFRGEFKGIKKVFAELRTVSRTESAKEYVKGVRARLRA